MMDMKYPDEKSRWDFISECLKKYLSWGMKYMRANDPSIYALLHGDTGAILVFKNFKDKPIVEVGLYSTTTGARRYHVIHNLETGIAYWEQDDRLTENGYINEMSILSDVFATWYGDPMNHPFYMINNAVKMDMKMIQEYEILKDIHSAMEDLIDKITRNLEEDDEDNKKPYNDGRSL
jgi:hypothetical protein